jgi:hypothetical protein
MKVLFFPFSEAPPIPSLLSSPPSNLRMMSDVATINTAAILEEMKRRYPVWKLEKRKRKQ